MKTTFLPLIALPILCACASNAEYRTLASSTGVMVESLKVGTSDFVAHQNALNVENAERLDRTMVYAGRAETVSRQQVLSWTATGDEVALARYTLATSIDADDVVASLKSRASRAAPLDDAGAGEVYGKASEALGKLSARPKGLQILGGLLAYADAVNTSYDDLKEEAAEDADEAADASDEADEETTPAVALQGD